MADLEWTEAALGDLKALDMIVGKRILRKAEWFAHNFESIVPEPLSGEFKGAYKLRIGAWRVIYTFDNGTVVIHMVRHRREVYKI